MMSNAQYDFTAEETCSCGASINVKSYGASAGMTTLANWRKDHQHLFTNKAGTILPADSQDKVPFV